MNLVEGRGGDAGEEWNGTLEIIIIYTQIRRKHVLESVHRIHCDVVGK